ncbi:MAG TPA: DNA-binding protein [Bacteroidales bacterium]|nr:DNA-binding protein [Bacteroidales bacterium]
MPKSNKSNQSHIATSSEKEGINSQIINTNDIENKIFNIRNLQVMIDSDLAELYEVETKRLNEQVLRNIERFPESFRFKLSEKEWNNLRSQIATSNTDRGGRRYIPYVFTEQGVAMLSSVLKSKTAIEVSIRIMNAFVEMRKLLLTNAQIFQRIDNIENRLISYDEKFDKVFDALGKNDAVRTQGIFFDGQIYDAYSFIIDLIRKAKKEIILIDGYVDNEVLDMLSKKRANVGVTLYTLPNANITKTDIKRFNAQYPTLIDNRTTKVHDRYLIIDNNELYTIGASLKDLGKKCFSFTKMEEKSLIKELLSRLV